ncbi:MAG: hypothetical protein M0Z53_13900 [Thermaerobacter sp.]|nr:hypothetical protein [Thermaerobacter sp.]
MPLGERLTMARDLTQPKFRQIANRIGRLRNLDFGRQFFEGQLAQYDVRPIRREGRGSILCAIDCSGSMNGAAMEWDSAVGLALMDTARRQKRDFAAVFFSGGLVAEFVFPKGQASPQEILRFAQIGANGGTPFEPPLSWAMAQLDTARFSRLLPMGCRGYRMAS